MRLESAMLAGREGIYSHGQAISVVGDNIANTNTDGYKTSRAEFSDLLGIGLGSQGDDVAGMSGSGSYVARVRQIYDQGTLESTGRSLDCGIDGNGFFMLGDPTNPTYSRAGNFQISLNGELESAEGKSVLGFAPGQTTLSPMTLNSIKLTGSTTTQASITGNIDATVATTTVPTDPQTFKEIGATASYLAPLSVYDSLGKSHDITVGFYKTGTNTWQVQAYIDGADVGKDAGTPVAIGPSGGSSLTFDGSGNIDSASAANALMSAAPAYSNGASVGNFTINVSNFTQFAAASNLNGVSQDGQGAGNIKDYEFRSNGALYANLDSGSSQLVGTIQLANFTNRDGLERVGSSEFREGSETGTRVTGSPNGNGLGKLQGATLERSTVDISTEFINLVLYQRGYQANSQTIQITSQLLHDTIGMMR